MPTDAVTPVVTETATQPTTIEGMISSILSKKDILESGNKPLITFDTNTSQAPTLNYSLPQKSAFTSYGTVKLDIDAKYLVSKTVLKSFYLLIKNYVTVNNIQDERAFDAMLYYFVGCEEISVRMFWGDGRNLNTLDAFLDSNLTENDILSLPDFSQVYVSFMSFCRAVDELDGRVGNGFNVRGGGYFPYIYPIFAIEEYKTASFLGDYGAGQTINTFTLLPNEKTTISITTYKEITELSKSSQNMLDSFSQDSADELENSLQENQKFQDSSSSSNNSTSSTGINTNKSVTLDLDGTFKGITASVSGAASKNTIVGNTKSKQAYSSRSANVENLSKSLEKSVEKSNASRQVNINTTSEKSSKKTDETSIVRELSNPNSSRVVNYVFRQLLQEYITITYLNNIKIVLVKNDGSVRIATIQQLDTLFEDFNDQIKHAIFEIYGTVENYQSKDQAFLQAIKIKSSNEEGEQGIIELDRSGTNFIDKEKNVYTQSQIDYYRKRRGNLDTFEEIGGGLKIPIEGIILNVDKFVLKTDSVIVDALLGQGEALDQFAKHIHMADVQKAYLQNQKDVLALNTIDEISDPVQKAEAYAKMYNPPLTVVRN